MAFDGVPPRVGVRGRGKEAFSEVCEKGGTDCIELPISFFFVLPSVMSNVTNAVLTT